MVFKIALYYELVIIGISFVTIFLDYLISYLIVKRFNKKQSEDNLDKIIKEGEEKIQLNEKNKMFIKFFFILWFIYVLVDIIKIYIGIVIYDEEIIKYFKYTIAPNCLVEVGILAFYFIYSASKGIIVGVPKKILKLKYFGSVISSLVSGILLGSSFFLLYYIRMLFVGFSPDGSDFYLILFNEYTIIFGILTMFLVYSVAYIVWKISTNKTLVNDTTITTDCSVEE